MMNKLLAVIFASSVFTSPYAVAQEKPPAHYENWGVCPFECCTYREWTAEDDIPVHKGRSETSPVLFRLRRNEQVNALTGVVVTESASAVRIDKPVRDGYVDGSDQPQLSLKPGDVIYRLSPLGEGAFLFWYQGKVYRSSIDLASMPAADGKEAKMVWWKQVKNKAGKKGWTTSDKFSNADACG